MSETKSDENCGYCGRIANSFCSACKITKYCSIEHQKKHWKQHKIECQSFRIEKTSDMGRVLIATRDITTNSVILIKNPICVGPKWYRGENDEKIPLLPCVGCYSPCTVGVHACPSCKWPACSPMCPGLVNSKLHGYDCQILTLGPGPSDSNDIKSLMNYYRTDVLLVLKCLILQTKEPKKWEELLNMESHEEERLDSELYIEAQTRIVSFLEQNFIIPLMRSNKPIFKNCDSKLLHKICGIIETNFFCIKLLNGLELSGIYPLASMIEHNCLPNCYFHFDHQNSFKISIIAGCNIKKGEHLKIMYSNMLWETYMRQNYLNMTKNFQCKCKRCLDPTELGTYLSAIKCTGLKYSEFDDRKCDGYLLPISPSSATEINVQCNKCTVHIRDQTLFDFISSFAEEAESILITKPTIKKLENAIEKLEFICHPNHRYLFQLKHTLLQLYGTETGYKYDLLDDDLLMKKYILCNQLLDICNRLDPHTIRLTMYVAVILFEKHCIFIELGIRYSKSNNLEFHPIVMIEENQNIVSSKNDKDSNTLYHYQKGRELLLNVAEMLKKELDSTHGAELSNAVIKNISRVDNLISKLKNK